MYTTIKISKEVKDTLEKMKIFDNETYEQIIEDLLEDHLALNPKFKKDLSESYSEAKKGNVMTFQQLKARMKKHV